MNSGYFEHGNFFWNLCLINLKYFSPSPALPGSRPTVHVEAGWMVGAPLAPLLRVPHGAQVRESPLHHTPPPRPSSGDNSQTALPP